MKFKPGDVVILRNSRTGIVYDVIAINDSDDTITVQATYHSPVCTFPACKFELYHDVPDVELHGCTIEELKQIRCLDEFHINTVNECMKEEPWYDHQNPAPSYPSTSATVKP